jgi:ornithine cyclodeaminase
MKLLVLSGPDVHELLSYGECVRAMRSGLSALSSGTAQQPVRAIIDSWAAPGLMGLMPSFTQGGAGTYGLKAICITPGNPAAGLDSHQGIVLLSDGATGVPLAVLNASAVTEVRTAAVSVLATELLARPGAGDLAVIGTGVQARAHILAFSATRPLRRVRVAGRDAAKAAAFAESLGSAVDAEITGCASVAEAVAGADIIVTATSSAQPVLFRDWVAPGAHVNAVGACLRDMRELDSALMAGAAVYADSREGLRAESGDFLVPEAEGLITPADVRGTLGEVLTGTAAGRRDDGEITVFESLGLAVEDLAAAQAAYDLARQTGAGQWLDF